MSTLAPTLALLFVCVLALAACDTPPRGGRGPDTGWKRPPPLRPGATLRIIAPAGPLNEERIRRAARRLEERGYAVQLPEGLFREDGHLAGPDAARLAELDAALRDPAVDAVLPGRGGYGLTRILGRLDAGRLPATPKIVAGFSDVTALHLALQRRGRWVTFHGPNLQGGLGDEEGPHPDADRVFWSMLTTGVPGRSGPDDPDPTDYDWPPGSDLEPLRVLARGRATGRLVGGNLSLLAATTGTPDALEPAGRILFLEDVGEAPYRVDRMLQQLENAGLLDGLAGVLLGQFTMRERVDPRPAPTPAGRPPRVRTHADVFEGFFAGRGVPVIGNFPAGHVRGNLTLPLGGLIELDARDPARPVVRVAEPAVAPSRPAPADP